MRALPAEQFATWSRQLRSGDAEGFRSLYHHTYDTLHRYVWYYTRDGEAASDVLQEVYLKLWQVRRRLDPHRSLKALLYRMARNLALNHIRAQQRHQHAPLAGLEGAFSFDAPDTLDASRLEICIRCWVDALPPRQQEAFRLSRYEGLTHEEIALVMHLAPKTVNNHIVLALQTLRQKLHHHDPDLARQL